LSGVVGPRSNAASPVTKVDKKSSRNARLKLWFPTVEDLAEMHDEIIRRTGGDSGVLNRGTLEAAVERVR